MLWLWSRTLRQIWRVPTSSPAAAVRASRVPCPAPSGRSASTVIQTTRTFVSTSPPKVASAGTST